MRRERHQTPVTPPLTLCKLIRRQRRATLAFNFSEHVWVPFKVIGLPVINLLFVGAQVAWLVRRSAAGSGEPSPQP